MSEAFLGLATGLAFGFLLQKGGVLRFERQVGALLFKDMTIVKFMLSAVLVGSVGLQLMADEKLIVFSHKALNMGGVIVGGLLFGGGWAIAGFCPETAVGALAEGRWHALYVVAGLLVGAMLYAEAYPFLSETVLAWKNFGALSVPELAKVSPWQCIAALWGAVVVSFVWFEYKRV